MRFACAGISLLVAVFALAAVPARSGEANVDIYDLNFGMRYCAAPWCDNEEFINTHFGIDAQTGKVMKYVGDAPPVEVGHIGDGGDEEILFATPPTPDNRYAPPTAGYAPAPYPQAAAPYPGPTAMAPAPYSHYPAPPAATVYPQPYPYPPVQQPYPGQLPFAPAAPR